MSLVYVVEFDNNRDGMNMIISQLCNKYFKYSQIFKATCTSTKIQWKQHPLQNQYLINQLTIVSI